jgi:type VI secretion system protein ImpE
MNATELYKAGKLQDAIAAQNQEVRANPADDGRRLFLFELQAFAGDLEKARRQIDTVNYTEPERAAGVLSYKKLLESEQARRQFFKDGVPPKFFADQPEHVHWRIEAVNRLRENRPDEAAQCLAKATEAMPSIRGTLNDKPFEGLRDFDDLLAGVLEVMAQGAYYWVPFEQIEDLTIKPPKFPRNLLWAPGRLEMRESAGNIFLPALYPGSHEDPNDQVKLGRATHWKGGEAGPALGVGLHMFLVGEDEVPLLEWRHLTIDQPEPPAPPGPEGTAPAAEGGPTT